MDIQILEPITKEQEAIYEQLLQAGHDPEEANQWVLDYVPAEQAERFAVTDDKSANWVLRKLAECDAAEAEITDMMAAEIKAITDRVEKLLKPIVRNRQFFTDIYEPQLKAWAALKLKDSKKRSVALIHGVVGFRAGRESLVVDDEEAAIANLKEYLPDCVRITIKEEIVKTKLISHLKENEQTEYWAAGDVVARIERGEDVFYVHASMPGIDGEK